MNWSRSPPNQFACANAIWTRTNANGCQRKIIKEQKAPRYFAGLSFTQLTVALIKFDYFFPAKVIVYQPPPDPLAVATPATSAAPGFVFFMQSMGVFAFSPLGVSQNCVTYQNIVPCRRRYAWHDACKPIFWWEFTAGSHGVQHQALYCVNFTDAAHTGWPKSPHPRSSITQE